MRYMAERHTITVTTEVFQKLRKKGIFGESYSKLLLRLIDSGEMKGKIESEQ
jgi:predicted CopG family antitoxin